MDISILLGNHQKEALPKMKNGCILCGGVGTGKSRTALAYYYKVVCKDMKSPIDIYIITTARKRDTHDWEQEMEPFEFGQFYISVKVDSWNNVSKYTDVEHAFFIFDEQRVVGKGQWAKSFIKISKKNQWILLSATPGDTWMDYVPVFIANGFYRNRTEFTNEHVIYSRFAKFPQVTGYLNERKLQFLRDSILIDMPMRRHTERHVIDILTDYDRVLYRLIQRQRINPYNQNLPLETASELCIALRRVTNESSSRISRLFDILMEKKKVICFYNFDYELKMLRKNFVGRSGLRVAEWNGHRHDPVPDGYFWLYLVQYTAGAEGWNCITTDTIVFFSQNYSYKIMEQSMGRIDRMNTPYTDLYYYHLKSSAPIDLAIARALKNKKDFNANRFINRRK